jgi:hypothetical protein
MNVYKEVETDQPPFFISFVNQMIFLGLLNSIRPLLVWLFHSNSSTNQAFTYISHHNNSRAKRLSNKTIKQYKDFDFRF